jgi:uncharacterized membrane protein (UPF0127 family)
MAPFACPSRLIPSIVCALPLAAAVFLAGCDEKTDPGIAKVNLGGKNYFLEIVADDEKRYLGMGKREQDLDEDGGMIFVFPNSQVQVQSFLMRDCKFDLDIIYLDRAGRVLKTYTMKAEPPRAADERAEVPEEDAKYHQRLPKYSSKYPSQFVIEIKAGSLGSLNLKEGDLIKHDWEALKRLAR